MVSTELNGPWRAHAADDELRRACIEPAFDDSAWVGVAVPGHWATEPSLASRRAVLHRTRFHYPVGDRGAGSRQWLLFEGIWNSADVWLDGRYLGPAEGWFIPHEFEVTNQLDEVDEHVLVAEVMSTPPSTDGPVRALTGIHHDTTIVGDVNPGGLWRPVRLITTGPARMTKQRVICTAATVEQATLHFRCEVLSNTNQSATMVTTVRPPGGGAPIETRRLHELASGSTLLEWKIAIDDPELWWPWELGDQPLYRASVSIEIGGEISDLWERTVGLRTVELTNFVLRINGQRLFGRGADLWPQHALPAMADPAVLAGDVERARDLGLNLLRVESHLARPETYAAADRLGMLLWQDLPMRGEVKRTVQAAAVNGAHRLVDRLGGHPSIAIWCAHYDATGTTTGPRPTTALPTRRSVFGVARQQLPTWTKSVLDRLVGRAFRRADGSRPVIDSSGTWPSAPRFAGTDTHLRFGWNSGTGRDLALFARRMPRMVRWVSSLGSQSIPDHPAVAVRNWPPDLNLLAERYGLGENGFRTYLPPASVADAAEWTAASQAYQATLLRRQIETLRRLKYAPTGGFTVSSLVDSRPAISFALFDHDRQPKAAVAAVRAACQPVIVVADRLPASLRPGEAVLLDIHVVNDGRDDLTDLEILATLEWPEGSHRWAWRGAVGADAVVRVGSLNWMVPAATGMVALDLDLRQAGRSIADNHYRTSIDV